MNTYQIGPLQNYLPPSLNKLLKAHWTKIHQAKGAVTGLMGYQGANKIPKAEQGQKRGVLIELHKGPQGKNDDPSNLDGRAKLILDGLQRLGVLYDDDAVHCQHKIVEHLKTSSKYTLITITDLEGE